jgi:hypothetical protein
VGTHPAGGEARRLAKARPDASFPTDNRISIELDTGARLLSLPGDPGTVRGLTASLVVVDETQSLPDGGTSCWRRSSRPRRLRAGGCSCLARLSTVPASCSTFGRGRGLAEAARADDLVSPRAAEFLERDRRLLSEAIFRREYMAEYSAPPHRHV